LATNVIARKNQRWIVVSRTPDVCKTPIGGATPPVPYSVIAKLQESQEVVDTVRANSDPVVVLERTFVPRTIGDSPGVAKGVVSGTVEGKCYPLEHSRTVRAGKCHVIRHNDEFWMNGA
jgi:hypothetical protein